MYDSAATTIAGISGGPVLTAAAAAPVSGAGTRPGANNAGTTTAGVTTAAAVTAPGTHNIGTVTAGVTTTVTATATATAAIAAAGSLVCAPDVARATHIDNPATRPPATPAARRWKPPRKRPLLKFPSSDDFLEYPNDRLEFPSSDPRKRKAWERNMREGNKRVEEGLRYLGLAHGRVTFGPRHVPIHRFHPFPGRAPTRGIDRVMGDSYRHSPHPVFRPNFQGGGVSQGVSASDGVGERTRLDKSGHSDEMVFSGDESSGDEWLHEFDDYWNSDDNSPRNAGQ